MKRPGGDSTPGRADARRVSQRGDWLLVYLAVAACVVLALGVILAVVGVL